MSAVIRAFLISLPLAFVFNALFWLLGALVLWDVSLLNVNQLLGLDYLSFEDTKELLWPLAVWLLAFIQSLLVSVPLPMTPAPASASALLPRVAGAAFLGGLLLALPVFALIDVAYFLPSVDPKKFDSSSCIVGAFGVWAVSWAVWIPVLLHRCSKEADALERFVARSVKGSAIGLALCLPWYLVLRRKQACHCALGTFIGLAAGLWSLLVVGGPLLLFLSRERRLRATLR